MRLRKLARLSRAELGELLAAHTALIRAQLLHRRRPLGRLVAASPPLEVLPPADERLLATATRLARAVTRAAENGIFQPACLVRAMALTRMLEARGIHGSQLRVGVRWKDERFAAHAWVEYGGQVLGDWEEHVRNYTPLSDLEVLPPQ